MPHKKKKGKNKPRVKKSNHKHDYYDVLVKSTVYGRPHYSFGKQCIHCGKVEITNYFISEKTESGAFRMLFGNEILEKYKFLKIVEDNAK